MQRMNSKTILPLGNVVRFPSQQRHRAPVGSGPDECWDHGPSPEESLRIMRAFVGIKSRALRADMIEILEGAARSRGKAPGPSKE